jgi:hypothetical protein
LAAKKSFHALLSAAAATYIPLLLLLQCRDHSISLSTSQPTNPLLINQLINLPITRLCDISTHQSIHPLINEPTNPFINPPSTDQVIKCAIKYVINAYNASTKRATKHSIKFATKQSIQDIRNRHI